MAKVSRTYRIEQKTADKITEIAENENMTATEVIEDAIRAYSPEKYIGNTANKVGSTDSQALTALVEQLAVKDEQIAKLMDTVADSTKAVQGAHCTPSSACDAFVSKPLDVLANVVIEGIDLVTVLFRLILIEDDGEAPRLHCRFSHMVSVL